MRIEEAVKVLEEGNPSRGLFKIGLVTAGVGTAGVIAMPLVGGGAAHTVGGMTTAGIATTGGITGITWMVALDVLFKVAIGVGAVLILKALYDGYKHGLAQARVTTSAGDPMQKVEELKKQLELLNQTVASAAKGA